MITSWRSFWRLVGCIAATYLVWVAFSFLVDPILGLMVAAVAAIPRILEAAAVYWHFLLPPLFVAFIASGLAWLYLRRFLEPGFIAALAMNSVFIASFLGAAEIYSMAAMRIEASRLGVKCYERHMFAHSLIEIELGVFEKPMVIHSHGRAVWDDRRAVWSYRTMSFEETERPFQAAVRCEGPT